MKRVAQFVRQYREELVLALVRFVQVGALALEFGVRELELTGALRHARLEAGVRLLQSVFGADALLYFGGELVSRLTKLPRARDCQRLWHERHEQYSRGYRRGRGDGLDAPGEPIMRVPKRPDFDPVRRAAGDDEDAEQHKHPI